MRDLSSHTLSHVVKQHAARWESLGLELGMNTDVIDEISKCYVHHPRKMKMCCIAMLRQFSWLYSWGKLDDAINKMRSLSLQTYSHNSMCTKILEFQLYKSHLIAMYVTIFGKHDLFTHFTD